jgi:hypothetical protein
MVKIQYKTIMLRYWYFRKLIKITNTSLLFFELHSKFVPNDEKIASKYKTVPNLMH